MRDETMTKKKTKPDKSQVRTWAPASKDLEDLAKQIFKDYPEEHKALHIHGPSRKVALDYMRVRVTLNTAYKMQAQTPENNYYLKIAADGGIN